MFCIVGVFSLKAAAPSGIKYYSHGRKRKNKHIIIINRKAQSEQNYASGRPLL